MGRGAIEEHEQKMNGAVRCGKEERLETIMLHVYIRSNSTSMTFWTL